MTDDKVAGDNVTIHAHSKAVECEECAYRKGYADGRKAAEKDFRELLDLANRLRHSGSYFPDGLEDEFTAWKFEILMGRMG